MSYFMKQEEWDRKTKRTKHKPRIGTTAQRRHILNLWRLNCALESGECRNLKSTAPEEHANGSNGTIRQTPVLNQTAHLVSQEARTQHRDSRMQCRQCDTYASHPTHPQTGRYASIHEQGHSNWATEVPMWEKDLVTYNDGETGYSNIKNGIHTILPVVNADRLGMKSE